MFYSFDDAAASVKQPYAINDLWYVVMTERYADSKSIIGLGAGTPAATGVRTNLIKGPRHQTWLIKASAPGRAVGCTNRP